MRFGVHLSIAGGPSRAVERALETGCETFQVFPGSPRSWRVSDWREEEMVAFRVGCRENDFHPIFLHTQYLVNLASSREETRRRSLGAVADALAKAARVGAGPVVIHIGRYREEGLEAGLARLQWALARLLDEGPGGGVIALEGGAGERGAIGSAFAEMARILEGLPAHESRLGICLDTAHLWGLGYDLSHGEGVEGAFREYERRVGLGKLFLVHLNDSRRARGSHRDQHAIPGEGLIGPEGFRALVNRPELAEMSFIVEESGASPEEQRATLETLRSLARR